MNKLLVFDFDGTLVQSHEIIFECLKNAFEKRGLALLSREEISRTPARVFFKKYAMGPWAVYSLVKEVKGELSKRSSEFILFPEAAELLRKLSKSWELHLQTSNTLKVVSELLKKASLDNVFTEIHADLGIFSKAKKLNIISRSQKWNKVFSIGDEDRDVLAAQSSGIPFIAVDWGLHDASLLQMTNPTYFVKTFDQLDNLLKCFE